VAKHVTTDKARLKFQVKNKSEQSEDDKYKQLCSYCGPCWI